MEYNCMKFFQSRARVLATIVTLGALAAGTVGPVHAQRPSQVTHADSNVLVFPIATQTLWASTLDPSQISLLVDNDIVGKIYSGLVKQAYNDKTHVFDVVPDLAAALPTVSKDGLTYTFKLKPNAKFSDGTTVTAQDFVYSWTRVVDPKANSPVEYYMSPIKGADAYAAGKTKTWGVKAIDASTLQVTLAAPAVYFLYDLTYPTFYAVEQNVKVGAPLTTTPSLVVGAGPWMIKDHAWNYRSKITLVPNPYYWENSKITLKEIDIVFTGTYDTMLAAYRSGQYPIAWLTSANLATYQHSSDFHSEGQLGDVWLSMNSNIPPFTNKDFRLAVAYAIDRDAITKGVDHGANLTQYSWYPDGILGFEANIQHEAGVPYYNPTIAKQHLALAMKAMPTVPTITLEFRSENPDVAREMAEVQANLKAVGISMTLHPVPRSTWSTDGNGGKTQFIWSDWFDDYPDPQDFSDYLLKTGAGENWGRYSNPVVDKLFAQANAEQDAAARVKLLKQAQLIILRDAPVAMLYQFGAQALISPKIHGMELNPSYDTEPEPVANDWANVTVSS
jgi:ABC-type oligopeptide transport system substrate-binding subunit